MVLFFRSFSFLIITISFLIFVGAEARTLLGNDHGVMMMKLKNTEIGNYGRTPYITPSPPESSTPTKQEIVGRCDHRLLPPPSPKHDPIIDQLTTSIDGPHDHEAAATLVILLPITVGGRHDHIPAPPTPKPEEGSGNHIHFPLQASY